MAWKVPATSTTRSCGRGRRRCSGFVPGGHLLLRLSAVDLVLVTPEGKVLDRIVEPADVAGTTLIGYVP